MSQTQRTKELVKHLRKRIKHAGLKQRVVSYESCGSTFICVRSESYEKPILLDAYRTICKIAKENRFTHVRGLEINPHLFDAYGCEVDEIVFQHPECVPGRKA